MSPFEIIKSFFNEKEWSKVSKIDKSRNFFIINRMMSINYPIPSAIFSFIKMPGHVIVEFWKRFIGRNYKDTPKWMFTKSKSKININNPFNKFDDEVLDYFYKVNECDYKVFEELKRKFPDELLKELNRIKTIIDSYKDNKIKK